MRRLVVAIPLLVLISVLLFVMVHLTPGGPAALYAADPTASPDVVQRLNRVWGLDQPLPLQYLSWVKQFLRGDWGNSFSQRRPVLDVIGERIPPTLLLSGTALVFSLVVGIPLGMLTATTHKTWLRALFRAAAVIGMSVPTFWLGAVVILVFSVRLRLIPAGGMGDFGAVGQNVFQLLLHLVGPAVVLGVLYVAVWARYVDTGLSEVMHEDYIRTAHAKGLTRLRLIWHHAMPNAALPLITVLGLQLGRLLSGTIVTEIVFSWPGLGRVFMQSLLGRDYPVSLGVMMILAFMIVVANILTDLVYAVVDPRVRYQ